MKLHSNVITFTEIASAVPDGCYLAVFNHPGFGWTRCGYEGSRSHARGFVVRLSGSSRYSMQRLPDKAATFEEWGEFLSDLYALDRNLKAGHYKDHDDFHEQTSWQFFHTRV